MQTTVLGDLILVFTAAPPPAPAQPPHGGECTATTVVIQNHSTAYHTILGDPIPTHFQLPL